MKKPADKSKKPAAKPPKKPKVASAGFRVPTPKKGGFGTRNEQSSS